MRKLTEKQIEYIVNHFFKNDDFAGWKTIAVSLLMTGKCIVAGDGCVWVGGIGNFIKTNKADGFYGCTEYVFDLEVFLSCLWYKEYTEIYLNDLYDKINELEEEHGEIATLTYGKIN